MQSLLARRFCSRGLGGSTTSSLWRMGQPTSPAAAAVASNVVSGQHSLLGFGNNNISHLQQKVRTMATKKAGGSSTNGRESAGRRLGIKKWPLQPVVAGNIIIRQRGQKFRPGTNTGIGNDHTIFATAEGRVKFERYWKNKKRHIVHVLPAEQVLPNLIKLNPEAAAEEEKPKIPRKIKYNRHAMRVWANEIFGTCVNQNLFKKIQIDCIAVEIVFVKNILSSIFLPEIEFCLQRCFVSFTRVIHHEELDLLVRYRMKFCPMFSIYLISVWVHFDHLTVSTSFWAHRRLVADDNCSPATMILVVASIFAWRVPIQYKHKNFCCWFNQS